MSLRFHEIAEAGRRILNPFSEEKLDLVGDLCAPAIAPGQRHLDLACGKGELLARWAARFGTTGVGVDLSEVFLAAAAQRATELGVADRLTFVQGDAAAFTTAETFDVVSCIGATWIGDGLAGTLGLLRGHVRPNGLVLVGDVFWHEPAPPEAVAALEVGIDDCGSLVDTLDTVERCGFELVEMVLADPDSWDRYDAAHWWAVHEWLATHADDPDAAGLRAWNDAERRAHLAYGRRYLGWGVFVLRLR